MNCYIGITTDPVSREAAHRAEYPTLSKWRIRARNLTRDQAQAYENDLASQERCHSHPGGRDNGLSNWSVYSFNY